MKTPPIKGVFVATDGKQRLVKHRHSTQNPSMSVNACSIRGDVKNIFLPTPEARIFSAASSPCTIEDAGLVSGPGVGSALFHLSSCIFISSDDADRFLKLASTRGCTVSTMVLSATRGLVLFRVIREGIGLTQRLSATGTVRLQAIRMLTLEPERLKNQLATTRKKITGDGGLFPETLKRLAISVCQRRSFLPSSIESA